MRPGTSLLVTFGDRYTLNNFTIIQLTFNNWATFQIEENAQGHSFWYFKCCGFQALKMYSQIPKQCLICNNNEKVLVKLSN